jgi:hypothetical protein
MSAEQEGVYGAEAGQPDSKLTRRKSVVLSDVRPFRLL